MRVVAEFLDLISARSARQNVSAILRQVLYAETVPAGG
jgi:hypothetical protein